MKSLLWIRNSWLMTIIAAIAVLGMFKLDAAQNATWTQIPSLSARENAAMAYDSSTGVALLFGGETSDIFLNDTWVFEPTNNTWTKLAPPTSPPVRSSAAMAFDSVHGLFVLFGGENSGGYLNDTWTFDLTTSSWTKLNPATSPSPRADFAMDFDSASSNFVLFGGVNSGVFFNDTWTFDLGAATWTKLTLATSPSARAGFTMVFDALSTSFILFGGQGSSGLLGDTWIFIPEAPVWTKITSSTAPIARVSASMAYDSSSGSVILFGGGSSSQLLNDTWSFALGSLWTQLHPTTSPPERAFASMVFSAVNDSLILFGGLGDDGDIDDTWAFNRTADTWTDLDPSTAPTARSDCSLAFVPTSDTYILFGGAESGNYLNDTWAFDPASLNWKELSPSTSPSPRASASMACDSSNGTIVLFGGQNSSSFFGDTWLFNPVAVTWTQLHLASSPAARSTATMSFDSASSTFILFGGANSGGTLNDTWEFNPANATWTKLNPATSPPPRASASMGFASLSNSFVLFGGQNVAVLLNDTWEFNRTSTTWTQLNPATSPSNRAGAAADSSSGTFALFGGGNSSGPLGDTWALDVPSGTWTQFTPSASPPARFFASMAYNSIEDTWLLFGGLGSSGNLDDTWILEITTSGSVDLFGPINLRVSQFQDCRYKKKDLVNVLSWMAPPTGEVPIGYKIYRDAALTQFIGFVKSNESFNGQFKFYDPHRKKGESYTYYVVSLDASGNISTPSKVVFNGCG